MKSMNLKGFTRDDSAAPAQESRAAKRMKEIVGVEIEGVVFFSYPEDFKKIGVDVTDLPRVPVEQQHPGAWILLQNLDFTKEISFASTSIEQLVNGIEIIRKLDEAATWDPVVRCISISLDTDTFKKIVTTE